MSNLVIVAIPAEDDYVWKLSSEKVPHCTLLFLGDSDAISSENAQKIVEFVEHAVTVTDLGPFGLDVDRRDILGEDKADVLFFRKGWSVNRLQRFRHQLLQNDAIKTAYDSTEQFPEWQPHLTMGYPETPAKEDDRDYPGIRWVQFDRIAVWIDDFDGPEFRLQYNDLDLEVCMSDVVEKGESVVADILDPEFLDHHGVKGMKWGQRKEVPTNRTTLGAKTRAGAKIVGQKLGQANTFRKDQKFERKSRSANLHLRLHDKAVDAGKAERKAINNKPEYKNAKFGFRGKDRNTDLHEKYLNEHYDLYVKNFNLEANKLTNASGTRQYAFRDLPNAGRFSPKRELYVRDVKHADDETTLIVELLLDEDGKVTGVKAEPKENSMTQTADLGADFLAHHGIKGMRWGHSKTQYPHGVARVGGNRRPIGPNGGVMLTRHGKTSEVFLDKRGREVEQGKHFDWRTTKSGQLAARANTSKSPPEAVPASATSKVPPGVKSKTKISVEGGENHPAHEDAIKVAVAAAKLKKSGPAALSNQELRDVAQRKRLEQEAIQLTKSGTHRFVSNLLRQQGQQSAQRFVSKQAKKAA